MALPPASTPRRTLEADGMARAAVAGRAWACRMFWAALGVCFVRVVRVSPPRRLTRSDIPAGGRVGCRFISDLGLFYI